MAELYATGTRMVKGRIWAWQGINIHRISVVWGKIEVESTCLTTIRVFETINELQQFFELVEEEM